MMSAEKAHTKCPHTSTFTNARTHARTHANAYVYIGSLMWKVRNEVVRVQDPKSTGERAQARDKRATSHARTHAHTHSRKRTHTLTQTHAYALLR